MYEEATPGRVDPIAERIAAQPKPHARSAEASSGMLDRLWSFVRARAAWLVGAGIGALALLNYVWTLAPTILSADTGRFQVRAYVLGIGHPTGYPTFIMLGKLFTYLPFGDVAYRVNLSSAVYGAVAVVLLYSLALRLTGVVPAAVAALAFSVSRTFWSQAVAAEVYTLHALFLCGMLLCLLLWRDSRRQRYLLLFAFLAGLSLTNHMTSGLMIPTALLFVLLTDRRLLLDWRLAAKAAPLFLLGLTPYLYLPIRAAMNPPMMYADTSRLDNFLMVVTGGPFRHLMWRFGPSELPEREAMYWMDLREQLAFPLLALAVWGLLWSLRSEKDRPFSLALVALFGANLLYALEYNIWDIFVYFIPTHLLIAIWLAFGLRALLQLATERLRTGRARVGVRVAAPALALLLVFASWWTTYAEVDQSGNYNAARLMERIENAPQGAVIYDSQSTGWLRYMQYVEHRRPDIRVRSVQRETVDAFLAQDLLDGRSVYALQTSYRRHLQQRYLWLPEDGLWRVVRKDPASALLRSAEFGEAVRWLRSHDKGGSVIANPYADRALRMSGVPRVLPAATEKQLAEPGTLPPDVLRQATDVRRVYRRAKGDGVVAVLERYDVRYLVLVKKFEKNVDGRKDAAVSYNRYRGADDLYRVAFENEQVIVYEVLR